MDWYMGSIIPWSLDYAPRGWAFCNGQELQVQQNQALFSLLYNRFGGNGTTTFNLPNLNGRVPVGACGNGGMGGTIPPGVTPVNLGQTGGVEKVTLTAQNMPQHNHSATTTSSNLTVSDINVAIPASTQGGGTNSPANASLAESIDHGIGTADIYTTGVTDTSLKSISITGGQVSGTMTTAVSSTGTGQIDIREPIQALNYIICIQGYYPVRP